MSDFAQPLNRKLLARVKARHQVKMVHIFDPYEETFPKLGFLSGQSIFNLTALNLFKASGSSDLQLKKEFKLREQKLSKIAKSFGVSYIKQSTHDDEMREITKSLKLRSVYGLSLIHI